MSLADAWHDARGPEPVLPDYRPDAQTALEFIHRGFQQALNERFEEAALSAGLGPEWLKFCTSQT